MSNLTLLVVPEEINITFGDFTESEMNVLVSNIYIASTTIATSQDDSSIVTLQKDKEGASISSSVSFGDFTDEECIKIQSSKTLFSDQVDRLLLQSMPIHPQTQLQSQSPPSPSSSQSQHLTKYRYHHAKYYSYKQSPPTTPSKRKHCFRCGYSSHTIENCVAVRNKLGDYIGYPYHPNQIQNHYSSGLVTDSESSIRPGDFVFNISDLKEWMVHDYEYRLNIYIDEWVSGSQPVSSSSQSSSSSQQSILEEDQKIEECLYLDYLTTNLLFENQAQRYFKHLYQIQ